MIFNSLSDLFAKSTKEMKKLNDKYEQMTEENKIRSSQIRNSIQQKSTDFKKLKKERGKQFDFIRNK